MKKNIYNKFDKKAITVLPVTAFPGQVTIAQEETEAEKAVDYLLSQKILGVDTETRPTFKKGEFHKVSLLQVSSHDICYLFRLNSLGLSPSIIRLLEDKSVPKIGLSWHDDLLSLHKRGNFKTGNFIDLQNIVGDLGIADLSLQKLYANLFHKKISKRQRLTNWDADVLNTKQMIYGATDAWACIMLYEEIMRLKKSHNFSLITIPEPELVIQVPSADGIQCELVPVLNDAGTIK